MRWGPGIVLVPNRQDLEKIGMPPNDILIEILKGRDIEWEIIVKKGAL